MFGKNKKTAQPVGQTKAPSHSKRQQQYETALSWETARLQLVVASERKAWNLVKLLALAFILVCVALVCLMPLKTVVPYVIKVDQSTGMSEILSIANTREIPVSEMMNKFWVSQYVLSRETYDWRTLNQEFTKVRELSLPGVFEPYASQFGTQKDSLEMRLKDDYRVLVKLNSIVINSDSIATVRFSKVVHNNRTNQDESEQGWTATLGFEYFPTYEVPEERRIVNPFGFKVTSYRVDPEIAKVGE